MGIHWNVRWMTLQDFEAVDSDTTFRKDQNGCFVEISPGDAGVMVIGSQGLTPPG